VANDVKIVVEASLGDTLVKLGLAKKAVKDLADENERAAIQADDNAKASDREGSALSRLTGHWRILVPAVAGAGVALLGVTGNMGALAPLVPVLTMALAGLIAPFTTVAAIAVAFVAPLTLITGLLGLLGIGFVLAGKRAADGGGALGAFKDKLDTLRSMFGKTTTVLAHDFLPYLLRLADAAQKALLYIDQLAHMPLAEAFRSMSTKGVEMLTHFLDQVGHVIGKPIRLAFDIAFGPQGSQIRNSMLKIWTQIQDFFSKPPSTGGPSIQSEIASWFGRQDFTAVGMRWAMELSGAFIGALGAGIKKALATRGGSMILGGAGIGVGVGAALGGPIGAAMGLAIGVAAGIVLNHYWPKITASAKHVWDEVRNYAVAKFHEITTALEHFLGPATWNRIGNIAKHVWDTIRIVAVTTFHEIINVAQGIWRVFDTLIIKTGAWKVALAVVKGAIFVLVAVLDPIVRIIARIVSHAVTLAATFNGAVLSAIQSVANVVGNIVNGISTAIGYARTLAGALGGIGNTGSGAGPGYGGARGGPRHSPTPGSGLANIAGSGMAVHHHTWNVTIHGGTFSDAASRRREAAATAQEISRRWSQMAGS
jgi:hypothetical protein